ncbi:MAG: metallophosphoesterase [Clostridia bacterium]
MKITLHNVRANVNATVKIALIADLHNNNYEKILQVFADEKPNIIAISGDLINGIVSKSQNGFSFLQECPKFAPTFYSLGNHELKFKKEDIDLIKQTKSILLNDEYVRFNDDIFICGLSSGFLHSHQYVNYQTPKPDLSVIDKFSALSGYKILLCHHPEYYAPYIKQKNIDLILSGHAHGGQIRIFGQGLFAPGQGFLPKYTSGMYDNRLVVSRGLSNNVKWVPRLFNETEVVIINLCKKI